MGQNVQCFSLGVPLSVAPPFLKKEKNWKEKKRKEENTTTAWEAPQSVPRQWHRATPGYFRTLAQLNNNGNNSITQYCCVRGQSPQGYYSTNGVLVMYALQISPEVCGLDLFHFLPYLPFPTSFVKVFLILPTPKTFAYEKPFFFFFLFFFSPRGYSFPTQSATMAWW